MAGRPKKSESQQANQSPKAIKRVFKESLEFFSDLFKLEAEKALKYLGWTEDGKNHPYDENGQTINDWIAVEHCHFFHTVDSKGRVNDYCAPTNGHFHKMEVKRDSNGDILEAKCVSGPLKMKTFKKFGKMVKEPAPVNEHDKHVHKTFYVRSSKLKQPAMNPEAHKLMALQKDATSTKVKSEDGQKLEDLQLG